MDNKQMIALGIALQTQVLKTCPVHNHIYLDGDENLDRAFALAVELVRKRKAYVQEFENDAHALTGLLSTIIGSAPDSCSDCEAGREHAVELQSLPAPLSWVGKRGGVVEAVR